VAPYEVHLPPGVWYDYWTGARFDHRGPTTARDLEQRDAARPEKPLLITPQLADLPVYVREGSIVPLAPVTQSTEEKPNGPLTLRVFAGNDCHGDLYQDDGTSFAFRSGQYLRMRFACTVNSDGTLQIRIGAREGSFAPWWNQVRLETFGWEPSVKRVTSTGGSWALERSGSGWTVTVPASSGSMDVLLQ
jgi:alpha-glucosidase